MADNDQSKIHYDDFVNSVQPDPAKPESTIMLSGFVGHGPEGYVRVYPDPTLGTWYDLPVADIVHSMPVADSKLGGSYIWVRASADIKPGSAAPSAPAAQPQAMAAAAAPPVAPQPTPTVQTHCFICPPDQTLATVCTQINCPTRPVPCDTLLPTPQTHCFICPPHTQAINCPTNPVPCDTMGPTPLTHCFICPPHQTPATICTQFACPTHPLVCHPTQPIMCHPTLQIVCQPIHTQPGACGVLPPSFGCTQGCPIGPQQGGAPQAQPQAMAAAAIAPQPTPTVQTHCFICPPPHLTQAVCQIQQPTPTVQTHCFVCPPHQTQATVCTQFACPTQPMVCHPTQPIMCHPTLQIVCQPIQTQPGPCGVLPPSFGCTQGCQFGPQQGGGPQVQPQAMAAAAPGGAQQAQVQPHTIHNSVCICPTPSAVGQCGPHPSLATVCTQTQLAVCHHTIIDCVQQLNTHFVCPTADIRCWQQTPFTVPLTPNGVFTPFGR